MLCNFYLMEKLHTLAYTKGSTAFTPRTLPAIRENETIMKKRKFDYKNLFITIILSVIFGYIMFIVNPIYWIVYGICFGLILFLFIKDKTKENFALCFGVCYLIAAFIISVSPFLIIKDFQLFHPHYKLLKEFTITKADYSVVKRHSNSGSGYSHTYATINYKYTINGKKIQCTEDNVVRWSAVNDYKEHKQKLDNIVKSNDFYVFVNSKKITESKMFYSKKYLYIKGSKGFYILRDYLFFFIVITLPFINIILHKIKKKNNNSR